MLVCLLLELPFLSQAPHLLCLRNALLQKIGCKVLDEQPPFQDIRSDLVAALFIPPHQFTSQKHSLRFAKMNHCTRYAMSTWLRQALEIDEGQFDSGIISIKGFKNNDSSMSSPSDQIQVLLSLLVSLDQYHLLADVMDRLAHVVRDGDLIILVDVYNRYHDIFLSIGALQRLFLTAYNRVSTDEMQKSLPAPLVESLLDLSMHLPMRQDETDRLRLISHQLGVLSSNVMDGPSSPISDDMVDTTGSSDRVFLDELAHLGLSQSHIDEQTVMRLIQTLISRMIALSPEDTIYVRNASLLSRLLVHQPHLVRAMLTDWLGTFLLMDERPAMSKVFSPLICYRVCDGEQMVSSILSAMTLARNQTLRHRIATEAFDFLIPTAHILLFEPHLREYRLYDEQKRTMASCPWEILQILHHLEPAQLVEAVDDEPSNASQWRIHPFLDDILSHCTTIGDISQSGNPDCQQAIGTWLVMVDKACGRISQSLHENIVNVLVSVNQTNWLTHSIKLNALLKSKEALPERILVDALLAESASATSDRVALWTGVIERLPSNHARTLRRLLEDVIVARASESIVQTNMTSIDYLSRILALCGASAVASNRGEAESLSDDDAAAFLTLLEVIESSISTSISLDTSFMRLVLLLHFTSTYRSGIALSISASVNTRILTSLASVLVRLETLPNLPLETKVLHSLATFFSVVPVDQVKRCAIALQKKIRRRSKYLGFVRRIAEDNVAANLLKARPPTLVGQTLESMREACILRSWELISDTIPVAAENDTSLNMALFDSYVIKV